MPSDDADRRQTSEPASGWLLRRADQYSLAAAIVVCLALMALYWTSHGGWRGQMIDIEAVEPLRADFEVDPNRAEWQEFAQIPGIGETIGRRIVEERTVGGPYLDHRDIERRVRGIGPKTLEEMRPYLRPMPRGGNVAGG